MVRGAGQLIGALVALVFASAAFAGPYVPPVRPEPDAPPPTAWFGLSAKAGRWCAYTSEAALETTDLSPDRFGWARVQGGRLVSVTVMTQSEDSTTSDRYLLAIDKPGATPRILRMERTGQYAEQPAVTADYAPGAGGALTLTPPSKAVVARMDAARYETYYLDWPRYRRFEDIPFRRLIIVAPGGVTIRKGCL